MIRVLSNSGCFILGNKESMNRVTYLNIRYHHETIPFHYLQFFYILKFFFSCVVFIPK